jgi:hypothetical protein
MAVNSRKAFRQTMLQSSALVERQIMGTLTTDSLILNFGSRVVFDINSANQTSDTIHANVLKIEKKVWVNGNGPTYSTPVFEINELSSSQPSGKFLLCEASAIVGQS